MAITKVSRGLLNTGISDSSDATAITIDSNENVGIGTSSPYELLHVKVGASGQSSASRDGVVIESNSHTGLSFLTTSAHSANIVFGDENDNDVGMIRYLHGSNDMTFTTNASEKMRIDSAGNVGVRIAPESHYADYACIDFGKTGLLQSATSGTNITALLNNAYLDTNVAWKYKETDEACLYQQTGGNHIYFTAASGSADSTISWSERMRISGTNVLIGKTSPNVGTIGAEFKFSGGLLNITNSGVQCMTLNRLASDGAIVVLQQDTTTEGSITVNGSTVAYNGFSGSHESSGVASDTAIGTVCSTIDELDTYVSGNKAGQTRADHAKIKVSDTVGDARVYGVLSSFSEEDNKPVVASVGIGTVLVTGACNGGDLLESNGDGTAKVQDDDIIRSKTIGKVTIGNSTASVKLVSCVLYCG